ncbi:MAG: hypothetical protein SVW77_01870 [Candidatus Nanohaloarchaea archaeon]|nr:hypothetical protein [Candidatus Nanohaloarchaea archaeon]
MMDTDAIRRTALFLTGFGLCAVSLGTGLVWAEDGRVLYTVLASASSWTGYLVAHYAATGAFFDGLESAAWERSLRDHGVFVGGAAAAVVGIGVTATGVRRGDLAVSNAGALLFLTGYAAPHHAVTGEVL